MPIAINKNGAFSFSRECNSRLVHSAVFFAMYFLLLIVGFPSAIANPVGAYSGVPAGVAYFGLDASLPQSETNYIANEIIPDNLSPEGPFETRSDFVDLSPSPAFTSVNGALVADVPASFECTTTTAICCEGTENNQRSNIFKCLLCIFTSLVNVSLIQTDPMQGNPSVNSCTNPVTWSDCCKFFNDYQVRYPFLPTLLLQVINRRAKLHGNGEADIYISVR